VKFLVFVVAGKQASSGTPQTNTGQRDNHMKEWTKKAAVHNYGIDKRSVAVQFLKGNKFPMANTLFFNVLNAQFDHEDSYNERMAILKGWITFLSDKIEWANLQGVYFNGMSRGGCFVSRFLHELTQSSSTSAANWQNVKIILSTNDPVCKHDEWLLDLNSGEDGKVSNPLTGRPDWRCMKGDLDNAFRDSSWSLLPRSNICWNNIFAGDPALDIGFNLGRAFCHKNTVGLTGNGIDHSLADQNWCVSSSNNKQSQKCGTSGASNDAWYKQHWVKMKHCEIGRYFKQQYPTNPTTGANGNIEDIPALQLAHFDGCKAKFWPEWNPWSGCVANAATCGGTKTRTCNTAVGYTCNGVASQSEYCNDVPLANKCVWGPYSVASPTCQAHTLSPAHSVATATCGKASVLYPSTLAQTNAVDKTPCWQHGQTITKTVAIPFCAQKSTTQCIGGKQAFVCSAQPSPAQLALDIDYLTYPVYAEDPVTILPVAKKDGGFDYVVNVPAGYTYPPQDLWIANDIAALFQTSPQLAGANGFAVPQKVETWTGIAALPATLPAYATNPNCAYPFKPDGTGPYILNGFLYNPTANNCVA